MIKNIGLMALLLMCLQINAAEETVTVKSLLEKDSNSEQDKKINTDNAEQKAKQAIKTKAVVSAVTNEGDGELAISNLPYDKYQRITPSSAMQAYLCATRKRDFELATNYLDYRNLPPEVKAVGEALLAEQYH